MSAALSTGEQLDLTACETIIHKGLAAFIEVGQALAEIRDRRLYRTSHASFEEYADERWLLSRTRAYQFIDAANVDAALSTTVDTPRPANEAQARALAPLKNDPEALTEVWNDVVNRNGGEITAPKVRQAVAEKVEDRPAATRTVAPEVDDGTLDLVRRFASRWPDPPKLMREIEEEFTEFFFTELNIEGTEIPDEIPDELWEQYQPFLKALDTISSYIEYDISDSTSFEAAREAIRLLQPVLAGSPARRGWVRQLRARIAEGREIIKGLEAS